MALPYENTSSGDKAMTEIQKILQKFGCDSFGHMNKFAEKKLVVQFEYRGTPITLEASTAGYAAAWLKEYPWNSRKKLNRTDYERLAMEKAGTAVYSILRDWIKGQITAVECGIMSFQGAFLGQIMLPTGKTVMDTLVENKTILIEDNSDGRP